MAMSKEYTEDLILAVQQICSPAYQEAFKAVTNEQFSFITTEQHTVLESYPNTIAWYAGDQRQTIIEQIRRTHLKWFDNWLNQYGTGQGLIIKQQMLFNHVMLHVENILFRIDHGDIPATEETRKDFCQIANTIKHCLHTIKELNLTVIDEVTSPFVEQHLQILFYFTLDNDLVIHLKRLELVDLVNTFIQIANDRKEILLNAYRILAVLMTEADIKQLQNSNRIASVFIQFISSSINGGASTQDRLQNNLRSLNVLTQHDEIREELIKQNGQKYFLRCALEEKFDPIKAKLPALYILLTLSFNETFATALKTNTNFMEHVRKLSLSSNEDLQRVATALIWQLEEKSEKKDNHKENNSQPSVSSIPTKKQYDIMISYSHSDKELCHQIAKSLELDNLRIWIDFQQIHGNMADTIAEAIENSEVVLICMSSTYKESSVCKSEATYAVKRGCHIIPLVMTPQYKADGWLGLVTSSLIYVDFKKLHFDQAYEQLKHQIQRNRTNPTQELPIKQHPSQDDHSSVNNIILKTFPTVNIVKEYPHCIDMWTEDHVKSFLIEKKLPILLGAFEGMNGRLLHRAYDMCQSNQQAMFSSLKDDIHQSSYRATLTLKDYLIFLEEIKAYIPYKLGQQLNPTSAVCNLM
ncbi:hypothetical protein I4U23_023624 [Adineta vaga]|nr:hypothetical protein I4U23_023624 [Adineta vaga]